MQATELTDEQYDLADQAERFLEAHPGSDFSPSQIARGIGSTTDATRVVLRYLLDHRYITADGHGAWTHYSAR